VAEAEKELAKSEVNAFLYWYRYFRSRSVPDGDLELGFFLILRSASRKKFK
jgi:hypothetical protein